MPQLVLQPVGTSGRAHYRDTILRGVPRDTLLAHLGAKAPLADLIAQQDTWPVWGVVSSPGGNNLKYWQALTPGATTLFYLERRIIGSATVVDKLHNPELAAALWGTDADGRTWENMYLLTDHQEADIPVESLQLAMNWGPEQWVRGFRVVSEPESNVRLARLGQLNGAFDAVESSRRLQSPLVGATDAAGHRVVRREQQGLRDWLLQGRDRGTCCLCGQDVPKRYLWASHLKPRSQCTEQERVDLNVVALMCKFGCDDLFEQGDVFVVNGTIHAHPRVTSDPALQGVLEGLVGRTCAAYADQRVYFDWHAAQHRPS